MSNGPAPELILVVEDSAQQRAHFLATLSAAGYQAEAVADSGSALARLRSAPQPAVIVIDWELPGISGVQLISLIQSLKFRVRPHLIMFTRKDDSLSLSAALERGANDFIRKQAEPAELLARLAAGIRAFRSQAALVAKVAELEELLKQDSSRAVDEELAQINAGTPQRLEPRALVIRAAVDVLGHVGFPCKATVTTPTPFAYEFVGWAGIGIPTMGRWVDIRVEANTPLLTAMAAHMVGESSSDALNPHDLMAEIANLVRSHLQGQLQRYGHTSSVSVASRCFDTRTLTAADTESERPKHYVLKLDSGELGLTVTSAAAPVYTLQANQLSPGLMLAEPVSRSDSPNTTWLQSGTLLTDRLIDRLSDLNAREREPMSLKVMSISPFASSALSVPPLSSSKPPNKGS